MSITRAERRVGECMTTDIRAIDAGETIGEAVVSLADGHVHGLPVLEDNSGRLVGVLSTSDVLQALSEANGAEERERLLKETTVRELMTAVPATIRETATTNEAAQHMLYRDVHRLFVTRDNQLVGVISQSDLVHALAVGKI